MIVPVCPHTSPRLALVWTPSLFMTKPHSVFGVTSTLVSTLQSLQTHPATDGPLSPCLPTYVPSCDLIFSALFPPGGGGGGLSPKSKRPGCNLQPPTPAPLPGRARPIPEAPLESVQATYFQVLCPPIASPTGIMFSSSPYVTSLVASHPAGPIEITRGKVGLMT